MTQELGREMCYPPHNRNYSVKVASRRKRMLGKFSRRLQGGVAQNGSGLPRWVPRDGHLSLAEEPERKGRQARPSGPTSAALCVTRAGLVGISTAK